jgi:predicted GTPase
LCNTLTGELRPISDSAKGVTFEHYLYKPFAFDAKLCVLIDTIGLNESDHGTVPAKDALKALVSLLKDSKDGYNLLIHVMRIPRITQSEQSNYEFFIKLVADSKIPAILVATGCENINPMSQWGTDNAKVFENMGLKYKDIVCTCFASNGRFSFDELRDESRTAVYNAISTHATEEPILIYSTDNGLLQVLKKCWNWLVSQAGFTEWKVGINKVVRELLIRLGFKVEDAEKEAENWK